MLAQIMVSKKYLSNFWRKLEMQLISCEINCKLSINICNNLHKILYLGCKFISRPLKQLKSGFKRTINWNKYQAKVIIKRQN